MTILRDDFLWGASTSGYQTEGDSVNADFWDTEQVTGGHVQERSGSACDSWHRYREDIRLAAEGGLRAYRFSIEWSRIEPVRGELSRAALLHYRDMIDACHEHGLEPVVTLHHFASPRWFAALGGIMSPEAPELFAAYVRYVSQVLGDVRWIVDINEPNILALMGLASLTAGKTPEELAEMAGALGARTGTGGEAGSDGEQLAVTERMAALPAPPLEMAAPIIAMHRAATAVLRETVPQARIGWAIAAQAFTPTPGNEEVFERVFHQWEGVYLEACADDDFIGVQAYTSQPVDEHGPVPHPGSPDNSLSGWAWHPEALGLNLRRYHERYGKPMLVTENGISTADDARRIEYTTGALKGMIEAVRDGADVRGYCHWSLLDNYEWGRWEPTFGLIAVDRETFTRTPKPSLAWLGRVAAENAVTLEPQP
ncbi:MULTISPECIES: family 1 glycosylhydrolase [unclassified Actinomyces]|uniref:glycoside hydrolase family 1 protein n=1 Tax=unclassified Actinomyces TaxID=2609248 RepID=UPI0020179E63|nr:MULTISPECIES: family 1 glycosylhydrolase [unclassified Actinomyces]MCL3777399.1 glycoside hydrolase family 1 protein [Actinomyces sp. AC-20-1]MCL3789079.1 glycoside hydrolase family 1 protein [Actinomyces sp. 187325]MCL3791652.1 glycoside hydrolase family 1 protein [Actinomyces sp. 186855]MCL3793880.1 glycoside hydrolase family 1 protein [Actinomyces sp. 217892]